MNEFEKAFETTFGIAPDDRKNWSDNSDEQMELDYLGDRIKQITIKHAIWAAKWAFKRAEEIILAQRYVGVGLNPKWIQEAISAKSKRLFGEE